MLYLLSLINRGGKDKNQQAYACPLFSNSTASSFSSPPPAHVCATLFGSPAPLCGSRPLPNTSLAISLPLRFPPPPPHLRGSDDNSASYAHCTEVLHDGQVFIRCARRRIDDQVVDLTPVHIPKKLFDQP